MIIKTFVQSAVVAAMALVAPVTIASTRLVPIFSQKVIGSGTSVWQSEIKFFNRSATAQTVTLVRLFGYNGAECKGLDPITLAPGALVQVRSIGCADGTAAAMEFVADDSVVAESAVTNIGPFEQDSCCLSGFTEAIPVDLATYSRHVTLSNIQVSTSHDLTRRLGRNNLGIINPNDVAIVVTLRYFDKDCTEVYDPLVDQTLTTVTVPARTLVQYNDFMPREFSVFTAPRMRGYWRVELDSSEPFYGYNSYVDNATNDATLSIAKPR